MKKSNIVLTLFLIGSLVGGSAARAQEEKKMESLESGPMHILVTPAELKWADGPASLPPGAKVAVIEGDLKKAEPITFRVKLPADYKIMSHTHPVVEHVTVLSGTFYMGPGETLDPAKAKALTPGSFAVFPTGHTMFAYTKDETVIQVHTIGPWGITYVNPADDPRKKTD